MTERDRLIELIKQKQDGGSKYRDNILHETKCSNVELADYLLANGVVVLPVDIIGNTLWFINCDDDTVCDKIDGIAISDRHNVYIFLRNSDDDSYKLSDIGKFLFYTREEAEKALAERSDE